jgi:glycyl-tRNA synthetase beta chain
MVYEFPELQGVMGEDYARKAGEKEDVARAVFEHYQPRFAGEETPTSIVGSLVSIADKIDTIIGCFSIGIIPTGSQDPYALRRQAQGIVQIMLAQELPITLSQLISITLEVHESLRNLKRPADEIRSDVLEFFGLRVKKILSEQLRYDVVDAVISSSFDDIVSVVSRGESLMNAVTHQEDFKTTVESFNRVSNLAGKAEPTVINEALFEEEGEKDLYQAWKAVTESYHAALVQRDAAEALQLLGRISGEITKFFDSVMVMAEDEHVKNNRLAVLAEIDKDLKKFADFTKLVW